MAEQPPADPYTVLQLPDYASYDQIKQRYRHLSKLIHPDKQPLENYQMAQAQFKKIDEAYKSISSKLRRYIYRNYGINGIMIMESASFHFKEFEEADLDDPQIINNLNQLMMYFFYEQRAGFEIDKNKLRTRTIALIWKPINRINKLPQIQSTQYEFETSLPDALGFSNTVKISHQSHGLSTSAKSDLSLGFGASRRLKEDYLLNLNVNINKDKYGFDTSIDRIINPNLVFHFIPFTYDETGFQRPQFGFDSQFANYFVSGVSDLSSHSIQIGSPPNKQSSKILKIGIQQKTLIISPAYERQITQDLRFFCQVQLRTQILQSGVDVNGVFTYGYKLKLTEQLKVELMSFIGVPQNYFQISFITPKFRANIPLFSRSQMPIFECYKVLAFLTVYLSFTGYQWMQRQNSKNRKRLQYENYNRLSVEKNAINKINNQNSFISQQKFEKQKKYHGLVICFAYMGQTSKINRIKFKIERRTKHIQVKETYPEELVQLTQILREEIKTNNQSYDEQAYEITDIIQAQVKGGQLSDFNVDELGINPCLREQDNYRILIIYWQNKKLNFLTKKKGQHLNISRLKQHYQQNIFVRFSKKIMSLIVN